jgi:hypothetical protein
MSLVRYTLEELKAHKGSIEELLGGLHVRIWSGEHGCWWRPNGGGYTTCEHSVGVYEGVDAWLRTRHCGPEKMIRLEVAPYSPFINGDHRTPADMVSYMSIP